MNKIINIFLLFSILVLASFSVNAETLNNNGDFSVTINDFKKVVFDDSVQTTFDIILKNKKTESQTINLELPTIEGWNIEFSENNFVLNSAEIKTITLNLVSNKNLKYQTTVISGDTIKISQDNDFLGSFDFPLEIKSIKDKVSLKLTVDVMKQGSVIEKFNIELPTESVSMNNPIKYVVKGESIYEEAPVDIKLLFSGRVYEFKDSFNKENFFKIYTQEIDNQVKPGTYDTKVIVRLEKKNGMNLEWTKSKLLTVDVIDNLEVEKEEKSNIFKSGYEITLSNKGNIEKTFNEIVNTSWYNNWLFKTVEIYEKTEQGIQFNVTILPGEEKTIAYEFNFIGIYLILLVLLIFGGYIYYKFNSIPLEVQTSIYDIKREQYEGIKSFKVSIGIENIKDYELEDVKVIFKMPRYLSVKENSFTLTKPNKVLKGSNEYKLVWNFKNFEKIDSRILGLILVNDKGILGTINLPKLEIIVTNNGKKKKYTKSFSSFN